MMKSKLFGVIALSAVSLGLLAGTAFSAAVASDDTELPVVPVSPMVTTTSYDPDYRVDADVYLMQNNSYIVTDTVYVTAGFRASFTLYGFADGNTYGDNESPVEFSTDNEDIAKVTMVRGTYVEVSALSPGEATLTAVTPAGNRASIKIVVNQNTTPTTYAVVTHVTNVTDVFIDKFEPYFDEESYTIEAGKELDISLGKNYVGDKVNFTVGDTNIAEVVSSKYASVLIKGLKEGETTLTAVRNDKVGKAATVKLIVKDPSISDEQRIALAALKEKEERDLCEYSRGRAVILGKLERDAMRISEEEASFLSNKSVDYDSFVETLSRSIPYPDRISGSGVTNIEYWTDETGLEYILLTPEQKEIHYVKCDENGKIVVFKKLSFSSAAEEPEVKLGDLNGDEAVDAKDATVILIKYAEALNDDKVIKAKDLPEGDYNSDGYVNSLDATAILIDYAEYLINL